MVITDTDDDNVQDGAWYYKIKACATYNLEEHPDKAEMAPPE